MKTIRILLISCLLIGCHPDQIVMEEGAIIEKSSMPGWSGGSLTIKIGNETGICHVDDSIFAAASINQKCWVEKDLKTGEMDLESLVTQ